MSRKPSTESTVIDEERALIDRARRGDREALEKLLEDKVTPVLRFGRTLCRNEEDALDVTQETLLTAYRKIGHFQGRSSLSSWLYVVARSICRRNRRRRAGEPDSFEPLDDELLERDNLDPEELAELHQTSDRLREALSSLSENHREVLILHDIQGLTTTEIGTRLDLTIPAAKSRIHRARAALAKSLGLPSRDNS